MRLFYAAVILALLMPVGCSAPVDAQRSTADTATGAGASTQLVKLNLPGMT
ncbi:MAG: hypothetical protein OES79_06550 [Planctomycetota bacterium]|nr:hypothetical protein [Planctomycetota bacterium]